MDPRNLANGIERKKFKAKVRKIGLGHLNLVKHLGALQSEDMLKRALLTSTNAIVRVYMISAFDLASRDNGSASDPYLVIKCNNQKVSERSNYVLDDPCPDFYKSYDFEGTFPGCSPLEIAVWDYDSIFGDDIIGTTSIDLEDRFFSIDWNSYMNKPIEFRQLYHPSSELSQGVVKCWVEIIPVKIDPKKILKFDISQRPKEDFQVRVCVLNCKEVTTADWEGTTDAYLRGFFDTKENVQETDTHWRCQDGKPDFQYRLLYDIKVPRKHYNFTLQLYDKDVFSSNEMLGQGQVDLEQFITDCTLVKKPLVLNKKYYDEVLKPAKPEVAMDFDKDDDNTFWLNLIQKNNEGKVVVGGKVRVRVDIIPKA